MSTENYISQTLQLPPEIPLFKYNVNFNGVKRLIQQSNIKINNNSQCINKINQQLKTKYSIEQFKTHQKLLNNSIKFGLNIQKYVDKQENKFMQFNINPKQTKTQSQQFAQKLSKLNQIVDFLLLKTQQNQTKINTDDLKYNKLITDSFNRLQDRIDSNIQTFSKSINNYFSQINKKSSSLQSDFHLFKISQENKIKQFQQQLNNKINQNQMNTTLDSYKHGIMKQMQTQIQNDQMKRLTMMEEFKNQLKQVQKNIEIQNKVTKQKVTELEQKVINAMSTKLFDMEKHKIFQKLSEFKTKTDQLTRKNNQFLQFRKNYLTQKQKMKQDIIGFQDQLKKMNDKESSFKKIQNVADVLKSLDPHMICQIANELKLHQKEIGKLEKQILQIENKTKQGGFGGNKPMPQVSTSQTSDLIQKIIKQYMSNMDFQGRLKKVQRDIHQVNKKTDVFNDLQKKIYNLSKDLDTGAIMKQLKRKCDQQTTKKQIKIVDSKIQNLFDYFKTIRKQLDIVYKRTAYSSVTKDSNDNPSLTSKKLVSTNCLSCTAPTSKRRVYSRNKMDYSMEQSNQYLKNTAYGKWK